MDYTPRYAPVVPNGRAGNVHQQVAAAAGAGEGRPEGRPPGDPPTSEAPPTLREQTPRPTTSKSTETSAVLSEDVSEDVHQNPSENAENPTASDDDATQPLRASRASPVLTPPMSSTASSQSLVLVVSRGASLSRRNSSSLSSPSSSSTSSSRSTTPQPPVTADQTPYQTQRRASSPPREGTLVLRTSSHHPQRTVQRIPDSPSSLDDLPNEVLLHILSYLDVNDLLATSRTSHHLRCLAVAPFLHTLRLRQIRAALPPLLASPMRPSLADLIRRHIFLTNTTVVSRKLTRSLVSIRLSRRLAARPPVHVLVERCVLPPECAPGIGHVAPALAARTRAIEREKLKDGLRRWVGAVWQREVGRRSERIRKCDESLGVGKVWRMRKFWERVSHGN
ncbi:hypothetical protein SEUCBS140593_001615 [Sporothrix eucalyptigena]|uniref:F-box domain-containing protein n=1 Tax=Sporothrix eucalyptigena TaxID=1812306 RepID=A0ABP0AZP1_9PEZI